MKTGWIIFGVLVVVGLYFVLRVGTRKRGYATTIFGSTIFGVPYSPNEIKKEDVIPNLS